jgi:hypothetical protein
MNQRRHAAIASSSAAVLPNGDGEIATVTRLARRAAGA